MFYFSVVWKVVCAFSFASFDARRLLGNMITSFKKREKERERDSSFSFVLYMMWHISMSRNLPIPHRTWKTIYERERDREKSIILWCLIWKRKVFVSSTRIHSWPFLHLINILQERKVLRNLAKRTRTIYLAILINNRD